MYKYKVAVKLKSNRDINNKHVWFTVGTWFFESAEEVDKFIESLREADENADFTSDRTLYYEISKMKTTYESLSADWINKKEI